MIQIASVLYIAMPLNSVILNMFLKMFAVQTDNSAIKTTYRNITKNGKPQ